MAASIGGSCNGGMFAEAKPEYWGEVVGDDVMAADVEVTDDVANNTGDDGNKLNY